ncbi:MAG: S8 family serine peptidase [Sciscionella sp.]
MVSEKASSEGTVVRQTRARRTSFRSSVTLLTVALATSFVVGGTASGAETDQGKSLAHALPPNSRMATSALAGKVSPPLRKAAGKVTAFIELDKPAAVDVFSRSRRDGADTATAKRAANQAKNLVSQVTDAVLGQLRILDNATRVLYRTTNAVPGLAVTASASKIRELAARDDVRSVRTIVPKKLDNSSAVQLTKTVNTWRQTGKFGDGVRIGVIDNGIDYTHADFGGPGTKAAYDAIDRTKVDSSYFPTAKVIGGTDLAGDDYDATGAEGSETPNPDPNPLSCADHGTHVAGTTAGFGENADGSTFRGDYSKLNAAKLNRMRIGPGTAPKALLYAIKVFGCAGSTSLTGQALDRALDPNGDGDFSDHFDVVNLSLGGDFGAPDDPDSLFVRKLAQNNVLSVIASGNAGDLYDAGGSPGDSVEALTVASVRDAGVLRDAAEATAPAAVKGALGGQYSQDYTGYDTLNLTKPVVVPKDSSNLDGCKAFSAADKAAMADRFVWLRWDDNDATRKCGSAARADNAAAAGAAGVLLTSGIDQFVAGIAGNAKIPQFQFTGTSTAKLRPAAQAGTLKVRLAGTLRSSLQTFSPGIADTPSDFTSRGVRGPAVKPDIAAPGDTITSALSGSGNDREVLSGTSMATPHTAGIAALIRQAHPNWTPEEVKADAMNTADANVYSGENHTGRVEAPQRVGAGRADALAALSNQVLAMDASDPGAVSVSFGTVEAAGPVSKTKTVKLVNKGNKAVRFNASYRAITTLPGVTYQLSNRAISLPAGKTATVKLTLRIDNPGALRKLIDPSMKKQQAGFARQFLADASGVLAFTPATGSSAAPLRLPVYSAPKPIANITAPTQITVPSGQTQARLRLSGRGLDQGRGDQAYRSLVSALQLQARSPQLPPCSGQVTTQCTINDTAKAGDLRYVGATSTAPLTKDPRQALLGVGIATWGDWYNIGSNTIPSVDIDVDGDGKADYETSVGKLKASDVLVANTVDLNADGKPTVDTEPINGQLGDVDTNVFDTNVLVMPVLLSAIGIDPSKSSAPISYTVKIDGYYTAPGDDVGPIDSVSTPLKYNPLKPGLWVSGAGGPGLNYLAQPGTTLVVHRDAAALAGQASEGLLLLNHHNAHAERAATVAVGGPAAAGAAARQRTGGR